MDQTPELLQKLDRAQRHISLLEEAIEAKTRELHLSGERLRNAHEYLSELNRVMPGALLVTDENGVIRDVNEAALEMLGYSEDALTGCDVQKVSASSPAVDELVDRKVSRREEGMGFAVWGPCASSHVTFFACGW